LLGAVELRFLFTGLGLDGLPPHPRRRRSLLVAVVHLEFTTQRTMNRSRSIKVAPCWSGLGRGAGPRARGFPDLVIVERSVDDLCGDVALPRRPRHHRTASWHPKADVSTVVPRLAGPVTSFQHSFIVREQGTARIWGHDADERAQQIIDNLAHPDARPELRDAGRLLGFSLR
jgi:hypothetical protein